jgi:predicted DNA-binding WGR domain protein
MCRAQYAAVYTLSTQPTLFREMSLIRNWCRIGTNGKTMMQTFGGTAEAVEAFGRLSAPSEGAVTLQSTNNCHSQTISRGLRLCL